MSKLYAHHKYTWQKPFGYEKHSWSFLGQHGGIEFHVTLISSAHPPSAGLEFHHYQGQGAPDHTPCWLLGGPCWHDGTSLYAAETLWPMIEPMLKAGEHELIFRLLESDADRHFQKTREEV